MTEREYLTNSFHKNFGKQKDKRIVIYGISNNTKSILDESAEYNILGLMDGYQTEGEMYGKNIISYEKVRSLKTEIIIVVARASSVKIIYKRIAKFCEENNILLFDVNGSNLQKKLGTESKTVEYFSVNEQQLKEEINQHDVISFDIFDTLITRKVLYPRDVFEIVAKKMNRVFCVDFDFVKASVLAELQLLDGLYPTYNMIYDNLQRNTGISNEEKSYLQELEFSIENELLIPRAKMIEVFEYAKKQRKDVYLVSDMYLPKKRMQQVLDRNQINGYKELLISCEYGTTKTQQLFAVLRDKIGEKTCLHIGDNYEVDVQAALRNEMDAFEVYSASHLLEVSSYSELLFDVDSLKNRSTIGQFIAQAFNNPFVLFQTDGRLKITECYQLGYLFIAPLISEFISWLTNKVQEKPYTKILFLARDGYLIEQMYNLAVENLKETAHPQDKAYPQAVYFLTSRIICVAATIYDELDIREAISLGFDGSPELLLKNRFLLEDSKILPYQKSSYELVPYVLMHKEEILKKAKLLRERYVEYAISKGIKKEDQIAVFDLAASGTCQMCLQDIYSMHMDGYYFVNIKDESEKKKSLQIDSLFKIDTWFKKEAFVCESYILLENVITSFQPTLREFNQNIEPVYVEEKRAKEQFESIVILQQAILDYFREYIYIRGLAETNIKQADQLLSFIQKKYTKMENLSIVDEKLQDEFFNRTYQFGDILD